MNDTTSLHRNSSTGFTPAPAGDATAAGASATSALDGAADVTFNNHDDEQVRRAIANYTPRMSRELWRQVGDFTRSAVTDFAPNHWREAELLMAPVARLAAWSATEGALDLDRDSVLSGYNIEQYITSGAHRGSAYTLADARRLLMRVSHELGIVESGRVASRPRKRPSVMSPYSPTEMSLFRSMASTRSTASRRHNWTVFLALAGGCGLSIDELMRVKRTDVTNYHDGLAVEVAGRTVTCSARFEDDLATALQNETASEYLWTTRSGWRPERRTPSNWVHSMIRHAARHEPYPLAGRLRATWIVEQLNKGIPVNSLIAALGVTTLRPLEGYLPYMTAQSPAAASAALRSEAAA